MRQGRLPCSLLPAFSILERIEWAATRTRRGHLEIHLATFSILERIEWAATCVLGAGRGLCGIFQYPRTDRMGCDVLRSSRCHCCMTLSVSSNGSNRLRLLTLLGRTSYLILLSVSSNGSNGLRQPTHPTGASTLHTFSILERIEWAATTDMGAVTTLGTIFQYPRTDRMGCD